MLRTTTVCTPFLAPAVPSRCCVSAFTGSLAREYCSDATKHSIRELIMTRTGAVLFLSAMSAFLFKDCLPFVLLSPSRGVIRHNTSPLVAQEATSITAAARGWKRGRSSGGARLATMSDTTDVCRCDLPTPGWVRMAQRNMARVKVNDRLPDVKVRRLDEDGVVQEFSVAELFGGQKGVLVGVPGAFTPTCSSVHLPEYVDKSAGLAAKGAEIVAFVSVNDVYVMRAWEEAQGAKGKVLMLSDGNGDLAAALGMMVDLTHQGMGLRCKRFMCVVENGVVTHTRVGEKVAPVSAAAAEKALDDTKESGPRRGGLFEKLLGREVAARAAEAEAANSESEGLLHA